MARKQSPIASIVPEVEPPIAEPTLDEELAAAMQAPTRLSPLWTQYLMGLFAPDEVIHGRPINEGLRRIVEVVYGRIVGRDPQLVAPLSQEAAVRVVIEVEPHAAPGTVEKFGGMASVNPDNVGNNKFLPYNLAMAVTRCESIIFRKILGLRVYSADEGEQETAIPKPLASDVPIDPLRVQPEQIRAIHTVCKATKIGVEKFIAFGNEKRVKRGEPPIATLERASYQEALTMLVYLHKYRRFELPIPPEILDGSETAPKGEA